MHGEPELSKGSGELGAEEAPSGDHDTRAALQLAPEPGEVIDAPNGDHFWKATVQGLRELPRPGARPDDEAVKGDLLTISELHEPAPTVQAACGHAQDPVGPEAVG